MNLRAVFHILGWLAAGFSLFLFVPLWVTLAADSGHVNAFAIPLVASFFTGICLMLLTRENVKTLTHRDAFLLTSLAWLVVSIIGAMPFVLSGVARNFTAAFFESVSGLTTTGATVLVGLDTMDPAILLWRAMLQGVGGLGIIVFALAVLPILGVGGMGLFKSEVSGLNKDKLKPRLQETARTICVLYIVLTILCTAFYMMAGMTLFDAICHAMPTVSTGGFSNYDASLGHYNSPAIELVAIVFMLLGGMNFALHFAALFKGHFGVYWRETEVRAFISIVVLATLLVMVLLLVQNFYDPLESLRHALFNVVSIITTTGFVTEDFNTWPTAATFVLLGLMFVGGCAGSTSGSIKVVRHTVILKQVEREAKKLIHPHGVFPIKLGGQIVSEQVVASVGVFVGLYFATFAIFSFFLMGYGLDMITSISAVASALGNVGPGLGQVGPYSNFGVLADGPLALLSLAMLLGRLELFTLLILFYPLFWQK